MIRRNTRPAPALNEHDWLAEARVDGPEREPPRPMHRLELDDELIPAFDVAVEEAMLQPVARNPIFQERILEERERIERLLGEMEQQERLERIRRRQEGERALRDRPFDDNF